MLELFLFVFKTSTVMKKFNLPCITVHKRKENCSMKITFEMSEKEFEELKDLIFMREGTDVMKEDINEKE